MWPSVMTLVALPILIGLGTWQWHRMAWKEGLLARVEARRIAEPVSYPQALSQFVRDGDVEYLRVSVTGTFDHASERHVYAPTTRAQGWHVFTLLSPGGGLPPVYVNRGWVSDALKDPAKRAEGQVSGPVTVTGLARLSQPGGLFTPPGDVAGNRWYARDLDAMRWGAVGTPAADELVLSGARPIAPFAIDAEAEPANTGGFPKGGTTLVRIPNNHLQYVVTWYGLALTLVGVFLVFARQRLAALDAKPLQP